MIARIAALLIMLLAGGTSAATSAAFKAADIEDRLGTSLPKQATFRDQSGQEVRLADYLDGRPLLLAPVDYHCQNICGVTLNGLFAALELFDEKPGEAFELLVISIDPKAGPADAADAARDYAARFDAAKGAHFLGGDAALLLDAIGFRYAYDAKTEQYAHPAAVAVVAPDGRLARWLYGYPFETFDLRLALSEAGGGSIDSLADRIWLLCFHYDPKIGAYTPTVLGVLQAGGVLTMVVVGGGIGLALRREARRRL